MGQDVKLIIDTFMQKYTIDIFVYIPLPDDHSLPNNDVQFLSSVTEIGKNMNELFWLFMDLNSSFVEQFKHFHFIVTEHLRCAIKSKTSSKQVHPVHKEKRNKLDIIMKSRDTKPSIKTLSANHPQLLDNNSLLPFSYYITKININQGAKDMSICPVYIEDSSGSLHER